MMFVWSRMVEVHTIKTKSWPAQRYGKSIKILTQLAGVTSGISGCKPYILWNSVIKMRENKRCPICFSIFFWNKIFLLLLNRREFSGIPVITRNLPSNPQPIQRFRVSKCPGHLHPRTGLLGPKIPVEAAHLSRCSRFGSWKPLDLRVIVILIYL